MREDGRTDDANSHFSQFSKGALKSKAILSDPDDFYSHTLHLDIIKVFYTPTNTQIIVLKTILQFILKQLRYFMFIGPCIILIVE